MEEISLHVLDIAENSINSGATELAITIEELPGDGLLSVSIADDGGGIASDMLPKVADPFTTSRTTRKVGLGLAFLQEACCSAGGNLQVRSDCRGTVVAATFQYGHIDRPPLGDMASTLVVLVATKPGLRVSYRHDVGDRTFEFDTKQLDEWFGDLGEKQQRSPVVLQWLRRYLEDNLESLREGVQTDVHNQGHAGDQDQSLIRRSPAGSIDQQQTD